MMTLTPPVKNGRYHAVEDDLKIRRGSSALNHEASHNEPRAAAFLVGLDWGTNKSCLYGGPAGLGEATLNHTVPTLVGYAKDGLLDDLLPANAKVLFGEDALKHRLHLRLVQPMVDGIIHDLEASKEFARHLRGLIPVETNGEIRAVIGVPANASEQARDHVRQAVHGLFQRVILVPEPFLAALGYREENRLVDPTYSDPVRNSLFVDIGGGTTDVCLVQGYFPSQEDQISFPFAGDKVDTLLNEAIKKVYPDFCLSPIAVRELKEKYSFVGKPDAAVHATVMIGGKKRKLELTEPMEFACGVLLERILESVQVLIGRASSDSVAELLQNIVVTGGGSRIRNLDKEMQNRLAEEGYEQPCVKLVGPNYKEFVARGALKAARQARENQWQKLFC